MRADTLAALRRRGGPASAYDLLGDLRRSNPKLAPQTIYRALAVLVERGCVHRLESLNAFVACTCEAHDHATILSNCDGCGAVEESVSRDLIAELSRITGRSGFAPKRHVIEVHGSCASCGDRCPLSDDLGLGVGFRNGGFWL